MWTPVHDERVCIAAQSIVAASTPVNLLFVSASKKCVWIRERTCYIDFGSDKLNTSGRLFLIPSGGIIKPMATTDSEPEYRVIPHSRGMSQQQAEWSARNAPLDPDTQRNHILAYVEAIRETPHWHTRAYDELVRRMSREGRPVFSKSRLRRAYLALADTGAIEAEETVLHRLTMKPTRTLSGVAPVTVLTRPHPCPGRCIFCPNDVRMPKSYLGNEPGAMRALMLDFDPFEQVKHRLTALQRIGHTTDKVELLVLGGTWSAYPQDYREWFIRRCFDAMNSAESPTVEEAHQLNEYASHRNVGLVIETRPDAITLAEVIHLRRLGVTRVQLGVQSLDDSILVANKRGHTVEDVRRAMRLLRGAGFKVAFHWMPNLLGATPESDLADFCRFWDDPALRPDEMKLYPTGLLRGTELYDHYLCGEYRPYTEEELTDLLIACKQIVPPYCRLNRVMRDIPASDIAAGVTASNLRQIIHRRLEEIGTSCRCIRCREVRREQIESEQVRITTLTYATDHSHEVFISAVTSQDRLAGFLRLSLPRTSAPIREIDGQAIIRQMQVYGPALALNKESGGQAQHQGIGKRLVNEARRRARAAGFRRLAVIAAAGTRDYYRRRGFELGELYMSSPLRG